MQSTPSPHAPTKPKLPQLLVPAAASLSAMQIQLVVACGRDRAIGERGTMPWYLPADLKHFKSTTAHTCLIMGRKTFESIGRALPLRRNIVVSSDQSLAHTHPNIEVATSFEAASTGGALRCDFYHWWSRFVCSWPRGSKSSGDHRDCR